MKLTSVSILALMLSVLTAPARAETVTSCRSVGIFEVYDRLLPVDSTDSRGVLRTVSVRYIPYDTSLEREARISLVERIDGTFTGSIVQPATTSIYQQLRTQRELGDVCTINLERRDLKISAQLRKLYSELGKMKVPVTAEPHIYLDSSRIDVVIQGAMAENRFRRFVGPRERTSRDPLVRWALKLLAETNE